MDVVRINGNASDQTYRFILQVAEVGRQQIQDTDDLVRLQNLLDLFDSYFNSLCLILELP